MMTRSVASLFTALAVLAPFAGAQDPLRTLPKNYWVEFDSPWVRVIHVRYRPHEQVAMHDHPATPTLFVYLSDSGPVRFEHGGGDEVDTTRPPLKAGQMRVSPGQLETHRINNLGDQQTDFLRVELKSLPLELTNFDKRIPPPDQAFWQQTTPEEVDFDDPHLRVVRLGVHPDTQQTFHAASGVRTLWLAIATDGASVNGASAHPGEAWDTPTLQIAATGTPAELVRVELK